MTSHFWFKAWLHAFAAASSAFCAGAVSRPTGGFDWTILVVGSLSAGAVAVKAYLSDASTLRHSITHRPEPPTQ